LHACRPISPAPNSGAGSVSTAAAPSGTTVEPPRPGLAGPVRPLLGPDLLLLSRYPIQTTEAVPSLEAPYNDRAVSRRFASNLLVRLNRDLGGSFDPEAFRHRAPLAALISAASRNGLSQPGQPVDVALAPTDWTFAPLNPDH